MQRREPGAQGRAPGGDGQGQEVPGTHADLPGGHGAEPSEINKGVGIYESVPNTWDLNFEKTKMTLYSQRYVSAIDSWSICSLEDLVSVINAATGWQYTLH